MLIRLCEWGTFVGKTQLSYSVDGGPSLMPDRIQSRDKSPALVRSKAAFETRGFQHRKLSDLVRALLPL